MSDNYEKDMALTLYEALQIIKSIDENKLEISSYEKTRQFIKKEKISIDLVIEFLKSFEETNYIMGPVPDDKPSPNRNKPVWVFKKHWRGILVYTKIKIIISKRKVFLLSLHEDEEETIHA